MTKPSWQDFGTHDESIVPELWDGVVGAWAPCLGPTGSRLHDHSRRGNWGTLTNMDPPTDWVVDGGQYALDFDGTNDLISANVPSPIIGARQISISCWFRRKATSQLSAFFGVGVQGGEVANRFLVQVWSDGRVYLATGSNQDGWFASNDTNWHHVVFSFDGNQGTNATRLSAFFDGRPTTMAFTGTITDNIGTPTVLWIGRTPNNINPHGSSIMDDMQIRLRTVSASEAAQLYQLGRGGMYQRRRRSRIYIPQAGFQAAWARGSNVLLGFQQP